jgi:hypothetical protein
MSNDRPQSRVVNLSFVGGIGLEVFPRFFGHNLYEHTSNKESNADPLFPSERFDKAFCFNRVRGSDSVDCNEGGDAIKNEVVRHNPESLTSGPLICICESNPVELIVLVNFCK